MAAEIVAFSPHMGHAADLDAGSIGEEGVMAGVGVTDDMPTVLAQEFARPAARSTRCVAQVNGIRHAICPQAAQQAALRRLPADRRVVEMQIWPGTHLSNDGLPDGPQAISDRADPAAKRTARQMHTLSCPEGRLTIERQVIGVRGDDHLDGQRIGG